MTSMETGRMHEQTCTHKKKLSPGEIKLKSKPWITNKIKKMIKFRNKLFVFGFCA